MFKKYVKTSLPIILIIAAVIRIFPVKSSSPIQINQGRYEEILTCSVIIADFDAQNIKKNACFKILPNSLYNLIIKHCMLCILLKESFYIENFKPDIRNKILNMIPIYFNGSKYKDTALL